MRITRAVTRQQKRNKEEDQEEIESMEHREQSLARLEYNLGQNVLASRTEIAALVKTENERLKSEWAKKEEADNEKLKTEWAEFEVYAEEQMRAIDAKEDELEAAFEDKEAKLEAKVKEAIDGVEEMIRLETDKIRAHYQQEYQGLVTYIEEFETKLEEQTRTKIVEEQKQVDTYNQWRRDNEIIRLNVGGKLMETTRTVLCSRPQSMLAALFSGRHTVAKGK